MKKISIILILLSVAMLVGFTFDYVVYATKLKNFKWQAEILKNKYYNEDPSIDYNEVKRLRDSLYFLLNQEKINKFRKEIYNGLVLKGYSKSYENFVEKNTSEKDAGELYSLLLRNGIYDGSMTQFKTRFYGVLPTK